MGALANRRKYMQTKLHIDTLAYGSAAIGRDENGRAVFVEGGAPGDTALVEITEERKSFARGHVVEVLEPGEARVAPTCPLAGACGGCSWQHVAYSAQLEAKRANVVSQLRRVAHVDALEAESLVAACVPSKRQMGYRNKLEMACETDAQGRLQLGFRKPGSHELCPANACPLAHRTIEKAPKALRGALRYLQGSGDLGIYRVGVRSSLRTKDTEIALWTRPGSFPRAAAAKTLASTLKATSIVRVMAEEGSARAVKGVEVLAGKGHWTEDLCGFTYRASAPSFFQVNTAQAEKLVELALEGLQVTETDRIADLYCGVGTFTLPLAERCGDVLAVESAGSSVRDLRANADSAQLWVDIIGGDSARELPAMGHLDALLVDPPRSGLADGVPASIAKAAPQRLAYISCDPCTWARDVERLSNEGYRLTKATPVDLFPQTFHCEVVSIFQRA